MFTLLTVYDEEWDILMFKEYVGSGITILFWQLIVMIFGYIMITRYLIGTLTSHLPIFL